MKIFKNQNRILTVKYWKIRNFYSLIKKIMNNINNLQMKIKTNNKNNKLF